MTQKFGPNWIPSKRFGVKQGGKVRSVDDFSQYLVNATVTCHEKIDLEGLDNICSTARFFLGAMKDESWWMLPTERCQLRTCCKRVEGRERPRSSGQMLGFEAGVQTVGEAPR